MALIKLAVGVVILSMIGCATPRPSGDDERMANYGERPNDEKALSSVKEYMGNKLLDPYSAIYSCTKPIKAWVTSSLLKSADFGGKVSYGFVVACDINAKNRLGGYTGTKRYNFLLQNKNGNESFAEITGQVEINVVR